MDLKASVRAIPDYPKPGIVFRDLTTLMGNAEKGRDLVSRLPALLGAGRAPCPHGCDRALEYAILTAPDKRDAGLMAKLDAVAGRVLEKATG